MRIAKQSCPHVHLGVADHRFESLQQAHERIPFFFGESMLEKLQGDILPECTGLWWK
jgi:hypothetical protein